MMLLGWIDKLKIRLSFGRVQTAAWVFLLVVFCVWWYDFTNRLPQGWTWEGETDTRGSYLAWSYFARWIDWWPFPQLMPVGDEHSYPDNFGVMLLDWAFEQVLWMHRSVGNLGGQEWFSYYGKFSYLVACLGSFWLLRRVYGEGRAGVFAGLSILLNFYASYKHTIHFNIAFIHWLQLGVIVDFLLFRQLVREGRLRLSLVLLRGLLLLLGLGHGLGYVAALNVTSFLITVLFGCAWVWHKRWLAAGSSWKMIMRAWQGGWSDAKQTPLRCTACLVAMLGAGWLYLPLAWQVVSSVQPFPAERLHYLSFWFANPLRLLLPYTETSFSLGLFDHREHSFSGIAGWSLLSLGLVGWWNAIGGRRSNLRSLPRAWVWLLPSGVFLVLLVCNIPRLLPLLQIFPWHSFSRVGDRGTLLYPVLLLLPALEIDWRRMSKVFFPIWLVVCGVELRTFSATLIEPRPVARVEKQAVLDYTDVIQKQAGEAIFEWPFCLSLRRYRELCPYYHWSSDTGFLRSNHDKKGLAGTWSIWPDGRLFEKLILRGWQHLLLPEARHWGGIKENRRQTRCLQEHEYRYLERHLAQHDYAGIQVQTDLMAAGCPAKFYQRFGMPSAELLANKAKGTKLAFVPLTAEWQRRHQADALGAPPVILFESKADFVSLERPYGISASGIKNRSKRLGTIASVGIERYSLGEKTTLRWHVSGKEHASQRVQLRAKLVSLHADQHIRLICNDLPVKEWGPLLQGELLEILTPCQSRAGLNELHLEYAVTGGKNLWGLLGKQFQREGLAGLKFSEVLLGHQRYVATAVKFTTLQLEIVKP